MCPVLEAPENGRIISTSRNVGARVTYSCLPGFELQGVKQRTCLSNGEWAYEQPSCIGERTQYLLVHVAAYLVHNYIGLLYQRQ